MRVVEQEFRYVDVSEIQPHPRNPRQGDIGLISQSIDHNGFFGAVLVQKATGNIVVGNHRYHAAVQQGFQQIPALIAELTDEEAERIMLVDNRANDMADYDENQLATLLREMLERDGSLDGTGFDGSDLDDLLGRLEGEPPLEFGKYDEDIDTEHRCPKCGYEWSGKTR
jgi:ParB-like chromosome segregation protein Spo0J